MLFRSVDGTVLGQANAPNVTDAYTIGDLSALADNGGFTKTMALSDAAPAVGTGAFAYTNGVGGVYFVDDVAIAHTLTNWNANPSVSAGDKITVDQRGVTRDEPVNMGAYTMSSAGAITGVNPSSGSWTGGYPVVISGSNLGDGVDVTKDRKSVV